MRGIQRGISTLIILVIFLVAGIAIVSAYLIFAQNQQKLKSINSFEDCAKYYSVMESYPEQCNTPDGKHFTQQLSKEERTNLEASLSNPELNSQSKTKRIIIDSDNYFDFVLPSGYQLVEGEGDYNKYITDLNDNILIGFITHFTGGESYLIGETVISGVPFVISGKKEISCPASIYPAVKNFPLKNKQYISIVTWCKDQNETQDSIYEDVVESIRLSPKLKQSLLENAKY